MIEQKDKGNFLKILDKKLAEQLAGCGFYYMEEKINVNQTIYAFEKTEEIENLLKEIGMSFSGEGYVEEDTLRF